MADTDHADQFKGIHQIFANPFGQKERFLDMQQPVPGVDGNGRAGQGMNPGQVADGGGPPAFKVKGFPVLAIMLQNEFAEKSQGRFSEQGISGQTGQKPGAVRSFSNISCLS